MNWVLYDLNREAECALIHGPMRLLDDYGHEVCIFNPLAALQAFLVFLGELTLAGSVQIQAPIASEMVSREGYVQETDPEFPEVYTTAQ